MRRIREGIAAAVVLLLVATAAGAGDDTWHEPGTPEGGQVYALERGADGTFYAGTLVGIYVSSDGIRWQRGGRLPGARDDAGVDAIATGAGTTAYAVSGGMLFKSTDAGRTWRRSDDGLADARAPGVMIVAAAEAGASDVVYAGTWNERVYRSRDGAETWERTAYGLKEGSWTLALAVDPTTTSTLYVGTSNGQRFDEDTGGVYRSDDAGASWTPLSIGLPLERDVVSLALDPHDPRTIYAGTDSSGVFKSTDGGLRWRSARSGLRTGDGWARINDLVVDPVDPNAVHAATSRGAAISVDAGESWRLENAEDGVAMSALLAAPAVPKALLAGTLGQGIRRSIDRGGSWEPANDGLTAVAVMSIAVETGAASTVYVGTYESGLFSTTDGGRTWSRTSGLAANTVRTVVVGPRPRRPIYVGTDTQGVLRSVDLGRSWVRVGRGLPSFDRVEALALDPARPATVYAGTSGGLYKTVNGGRSWKAVARTGSSVTAIAIDAARPKTVYAGAGTRVRVSTDAGKTWRVVALGSGRTAADADVRALAVAARTGDVFAAVNNVDDATGLGVYRLRRGGTSWTRIVKGLPRPAGAKLTELRALATNPRTGAVSVATNLGLYELVRKPGGLHWQLADPAFAGRTVRRIAFAPDGSRLYAATAGSFLVSR